MAKWVYLKNRRSLLWVLCGVILCLPLIIDGFTQLLTPYESNNPMRVVTGFGFGVGLGVLISAAYSARAKYFTSAADVKLPAGVRFQLVDQEE